MSAETLQILLTEDDDGHATLIQRNLERAGLLNEIVRLRDGQETLDYLLGGNGEHTARACLVLLDIKMPRVDGIEVLRQLRQDPRTASLPVIMLTTTDDPREVERCYRLGCNVYITKPVGYQAFIEAVRRLGLFLQVVKIPPAAGRALDPAKRGIAT